MQKEILESQVKLYKNYVDPDFFFFGYRTKLEVKVVIENCFVKYMPNFFFFTCVVVMVRL